MELVRWFNLNKNANKKPNTVVDKADNANKKRNAKVN